MAQYTKKGSNDIFEIIRKDEGRFTYYWVQGVNTPTLVYGEKVFKEKFKEIKQIEVKK